MSEAVLAPTPPTRTVRSRAATREVWLDRLARFLASGLTVAQFCAIEAVSVPAFYYWKRRLAAQDQDSATSQYQQVQPGPRLLPVTLQPAPPAIELVLSSGAVLRLPPGCDLAWVRSLVAALGDPPC
jgi:transposase